MYKFNENEQSRRDCSFPSKYLDGRRIIIYLEEDVHNLRHLRYIVEAARLGSITQASRLLRVSQPAISAAIRGLEDEFSIRIFVRSPSQGMALTPSGRSFVNRARELLESARDFEQLFRSAENYE